MLADLVLRPSDVAGWPAERWGAFLDALSGEGVTHNDEDALDFAARLLSGDADRSSYTPNLREDCRGFTFAERQLLAAWFWPNPYLIPVTHAQLMCFNRAHALTGDKALPVSARKRASETLQRLVSAAAEFTPAGIRGELLTCISETPGKQPPVGISPKPPVSRRRLLAIFSGDKSHLDVETLFTITQALLLTVEEDRWWFDNPNLLRLTFEHFRLRRRLLSSAESLGFEELRDLMDRAGELGAENQPDWREAARPWEFHARLPSPPGESKYRLLFDELDSLPGDHPPVPFSLHYLHKLLAPYEPPTSVRGRPGGRGLAPSSLKHNAWWANQPIKTQTRAWLAAGFRSTTPRWKGPQSRRDPVKTIVTFEPMQGRELWWPHREELRQNPAARPILGAPLMDNTI